MFKRLLNLVITNVFLCFFFLIVFAQIIEKINISGNQRVSSETIIMFADIKLNEIYDDKKSNEILKIYIIQIFLKIYLLHSKMDY